MLQWFVASSYYKNGTIDGAPESHTRIGGNRTGSLASQMDIREARI
jgi:hypothetical protein